LGLSARTASVFVRHEGTPVGQVFNRGPGG
jgi:hypothetical protein